MLRNLLISALTVASVSHVGAVPAPSGKEYEYIVVGSGAGGGSLAASLSRKGHSVLLLEAGGDHGESVLQQIPSMGGVAADNGEMSWHFWIRHFRNETEARLDSKFTYRLPDGSLHVGFDPPEGAVPLGNYYPRGATLGGSTQTNAAGFVLSSDKDWEYMAELTGDDSWGPDSMREYYKHLEDCHYLPEGSPGHGFDGFISSNQNNLDDVVNRLDNAEVLAHIIQETEGVEVRDSEHFRELLQRDINHADHSYTPGVYMDVVSIDERRRRSGTRNYIVQTVEEGHPLTVSTHSLVTRVLLKKGVPKPRAYGVEYMVGEALYGADDRYDPAQTGELRTATASKEVIVAGGALNTPQILMLSGIGPREELERHGIPVLVDLPAVGANLQDHSEGVLIANASAPWAGAPGADCTGTLDSSDPCFVDWEENGAGIYGHAGAPQAARIRTSFSETGEVDIWAVAASNAVARGFYPGYSVPPGPAPNSWSWIMVKVQAPGHQSTGAVTLHSADPRAPPDIQFDWLQGEAGERDLQALAEGAGLLMRSLEAAPEQYQPITRHQPAEDDDLIENLKHEAFGHHASSTCRMGRANDEYACVDAQLRVNGVKGLRVADASVFPYTPGAFPALSVHLVGLKAADMIAEAARSG